MENSDVRVRFAPAPTGFLHIGGARTALYNWLFARHHGGTFILRIEDTDRERSTPEATEAILESMKWLNLNWDGEPHYQSERLDLYRRSAEALLRQGIAYEETTARGKAIRFRPPRDTIRIDDIIHGIIQFDGSLLEDFIIMKSDGFPTYNFACVVDDAEMRITHVIRGDDHISNTPRQITLYRALGKRLPKFAHIPMILGQDGSRLSKRHGATSVMEYKRLGFLPEALVNFLALLGWSPGNDVEILSLQEMIEKFTLERVKSTSAQFNMEKLLWMNGRYIKKAEPGRLASLVKDYLREEGLDAERFSDEWLVRLITIYQERMKTLRDFARDARFFFSEKITYSEESLKKYLSDDGCSRLRRAFEVLSGLKDFSGAHLEKALRKLASEEKVGFARVAQPIRVAVSGTDVSPPIFDTLELLGKQRSLQRIEQTLSMIGSRKNSGAKG